MCTMPSSRSTPLKKKEKLKEDALRRLAKKKPEIIAGEKTAKEEDQPSLWIYIALMIGGVILLFVGSATGSLPIVIIAMVMSFYGSLRYSYVVTKTKPAKKKTKAKVIAEEKL